MGKVQVITRRETRRARWRWPSIGRNRRGQWRILNVWWGGRFVGVDGHPTFRSAVVALVKHARPLSVSEDARE